METNNMNDQNYGPYNPQNLPTEIDPEFPPVNRSRSQTWPSNNCPVNRPEGLQTLEYNQTLETCEEHGSASSFNLLSGIPDVTLFEQDESSDPTDDLSPQSGMKKSSSRRNAWGNHSYADLITQAIQNSPEKRLTLSQIYDWMVQNVEYFKDKGDSNSSAGWKVSAIFLVRFLLWDQNLSFSSQALMLRHGISTAAFCIDLMRFSFSDKNFYRPKVASNIPAC